jgi:hypothetical protein
MIAETAPAIALEQMVTEGLRCVGEDRAMTRKPFDGCQWRTRKLQPGASERRAAYRLSLPSW